MSFVEQIIAVGPTAAGSAPANPPILVAGSDGTDVRTLATDSTGQAKVLNATMPVNSQTWVSGTSGTSASISCSGYTTALATFNPTGTVSAGQVTFELSDDGGTTWYPVTAKNSSSVSNTSSVTPVSSTAFSVQINVAGASNVRLRNSIAISGGGSIVVRIQASAAYGPTPVALVNFTPANLTTLSNIQGSTGAVMDAVITVATAPPNALATLSICQTTAPAVSDGQSVATQCDYVGSVFVKPYRRSQTVSQSTTIAASTTATTIMAAQGSGFFADISSLIISVVPVIVSPVAFTATLSDNTKSYVFDLDQDLANGTQMLILHFPAALPASSSNTVWTLTLSSATPTVHVTAVAIVQKTS